MWRIQIEMGAQMDILQSTTDLLQKTEITEMNLQETKGRDKSVLAKITKFPHQTGFHQNSGSQNNVRRGLF
jgi:hypothetical protein